MATINQDAHFEQDLNIGDNSKFIRERISGCLGRNFIPRFWSSLEKDFTCKFGKDRTEKILTSYRIGSLKKSVSPTIKKSVSIGKKQIKLSKKFKEQSKDDIAQLMFKREVAENLRLGLLKRKELVFNLTTLLDEATCLLTNNFLNADRCNRVKFLFDSISAGADSVVNAIGETIASVAVMPDELSAIDR